MQNYYVPSSNSFPSSFSIISLKLYIMINPVKISASFTQILHIISLKLHILIPYITGYIPLDTNMSVCNVSTCKFHKETELETYDMKNAALLSSVYMYNYYYEVTY